MRVCERNLAQANNEFEWTFIFENDAEILDVNRLTEIASQLSLSSTTTGPTLILISDGDGLIRGKRDKEFAGWLRIRSIVQMPSRATAYIVNNEFGRVARSVRLIGTADWPTWIRPVDKYCLIEQVVDYPRVEISTISDHQGTRFKSEWPTYRYRFLPMLRQIFSPKMRNAWGGFCN